MLNICPACGLYNAEKTVRAAPELGPWMACAICPHCGAEYPFLRLPLFSITGASGTGKSALAFWVAARHNHCVHLESDILWGAVPASPEDNYRSYRDTWLRVCKHIAQAGRPVALYGSVVPEQWEICPERRYHGPIHTLALVCAPERLEERLRARPSWRHAGSAEFIDNMQAFNAWFIEYANRLDPPMTLLDTTHSSLEKTGEALLRWINLHWQPEVREAL